MQVPLTHSERPAATLGITGQIQSNYCIVLCCIVLYCIVCLFNDSFYNSGYSLIQTNIKQFMEFLNHLIYCKKSMCVCFHETKF